MKTNAGAARMLALPALAVLAVLLGGARAGADQGVRGKCDAHNTPKIRVTVNGRIDKWYSSSYGEDIVVNCSAIDTAKLELKENGISIRSNQTNTTSIQFRVTTPNIGTYTFSCAYSAGTGCEALMPFEVKPATSVESSRVQRGLDRGLPIYYVPLGDNYDVYCSGNDGVSLLLQNNDELLQTDVVNGTTIKHHATHSIGFSSIYRCKANVTKVTGEQEIVNNKPIQVLHFPIGYHFWCILKCWRTIECSWTYPSYWDEVTYTLFYLNHDEQENLFYCGNTRGERNNNTCKWSIRLKPEFYINNHNFSLMLMTCKYLYCYNQTFLMNVYSITRLDSVGWLLVSTEGSQDVVLTWRAGRIYFQHESPVVYGSLLREVVVCKSCSYEYKVEYRLTAFEDGWHATIASSSVLCDDEKECKYLLALPYPNEEYEVRVSTRLKQATDDRLWSDPESTFVYTEPRAECACERFAEPTTKYSFESASCDICTFTRDTTINNNLALKRKAQDMKQKLAKINYIKMGKELHYSD